ncbi:hypothetical protein GQ54DRAFT_313370 [Martensiomyces pterosporus]|nr:hypothetical protein GQ54DRAFT_313370 [Martensiomyces pterosporus]
MPSGSQPTIAHSSNGSDSHRLHLPKLARGSYVIDNECSMARDQFAAERNFLSWVKLAMAMVVSASMIQKDFGHHVESIIYARLAEVSTVYFIILAMVMLILSTAYVWEAQFKLSKLKTPVRVVRVLALQVLGSLAAVSLIFVLAVSYSRVVDSRN